MTEGDRRVIAGRYRMVRAIGHGGMGVVWQGLRAHRRQRVSPETLRSGVVDERTDVYGLGAVLHFALTGRSPHPSRIGEQPGERVLRVLGDPVPAISRPDVPVELSTVVARLLAADAVHRPDQASWAVERLGAMVPGAAVAVPVAPPVRRSRRALFVAAAGVVVCLVLLGLLLPGSGGGSAPQPSPQSSPQAVTIELAEPVEQGGHVVLTWTSSRPLDMVVVVDPDGEPRRYVLTERNQTTARVPVDPVRRYCFRVRGTDGEHFHESRPKSFRGAVCPT